MDYEVSKKSAVFGLTFHGRQFIRRFVKEDLNLALILDNDPCKIGVSFCNLPIVLPERSTIKEIEQYFVIGRYALEHEQQLINLGVRKNAIKHVSRSEIALQGDALKQRDQITESYLRTISEACDAIGCVLYLDSSGLLAAARNEALGGLSDVDLLLENGSIVELETVLKKINPNWLIQSSIDQTKPNEKSQITVMSGSLTSENSEPAIIDIRGPYLNPKIVGQPSLLDLHFRKHSKKFKGTSVKFPHRYDEYLEVLYGPNWKIPDQFYRP